MNNKEAREGRAGWRRGRGCSCLHRSRALSFYRHLIFISSVLAISAVCHRLMRCPCYHVIIIVMLSYLHIILLSSLFWLCLALASISCYQHFAARSASATKRCIAGAARRRHTLARRGNAVAPDGGNGERRAACAYGGASHDARIFALRKHSACWTVLRDTRHLRRRRRA